MSPTSTIGSEETIHHGDEKARKYSEPRQRMLTVRHMATTNVSVNNERSENWLVRLSASCGCE
jgi:hypothetical protein